MLLHAKLLPLSKGQLSGDIKVGISGRLRAAYEPGARNAAEACLTTPFSALP